jgi:hypothetical protein
MRAELSLEIGRPPEAVWGYLTEVSNLPAAVRRPLGAA